MKRHDNPGMLWWLVLLAAAGTFALTMGFFFSPLNTATARLIPLERRGMATGVVNAGGSFGQFLIAHLAAALTVRFGWASAM